MGTPLFEKVRFTQNKPEKIIFGWYRIKDSKDFLPQVFLMTSESKAMTTRQF